VENAVSDYKTRTDELMSRTLQLAQEQITSYVNEQKRVCVAINPDVAM